MGVTDKMWDAVAKVIRMDDKVERLGGCPRIGAVARESGFEAIFSIK